MSTMDTVVKFIQDSGMFIYVSMAIMALGLSIAIERFIFLARARQANRKTWDSILPLLMTGTSLLQVALQPTPPDPTQAKMMWLMPIAFSVALFSFPAGLTLYWITNNSLTILQQWMINRQINGPKKKDGVSDAKVVKG